ncbi:MAG: hypothetical protein JJU02_13595 [Cryomorphaceae bacterium]|nr:hypothetical protein [Cryomorphaceae bacterium]
MGDSLQRDLEELCLNILRDRGENTAILLENARSLYEKLVIIQHEQLNSNANKSSQQDATPKAQPVPKETKSTKPPIEIEEEKIEKAKPVEDTKLAVEAKTTGKVSEQTEKSPEPANSEVREKEPEIFVEAKESDTEKAEEKIVSKPKKARDNTPQSSHLNQRLQPGSVRVGLNDRIAFVKKLFHGETDDFNRVLSQINSFGTYHEAEAFLQNLVVPEYGWDLEEEFAKRFLNLVRMRFGLDEIPEE